MNTFFNRLVTFGLLISLFSNPAFSDLKPESIWKKLFGGLGTGQLDGPTQNWMHKPGTKIKLFSVSDAGKELHIDSVGGTCDGTLVDGTCDGNWVGGTLVFNSCECGTTECIPILPPMYTFDFQELTYSTSTFWGIAKRWSPVLLGAGLLAAGAGTGGALSGAANAAGSQLNPQGNGQADLHATRTVKQIVKNSTNRVKTTAPGTEVAPIAINLGGRYSDIIATYKGFLITAKNQLNPNEKDKNVSKHERDLFNKSVITWKENGGTLKDCSSLMNEKLDRILANQSNLNSKPASGNINQDDQQKGASSPTGNGSPVSDPQSISSSTNPAENY